MNKILSVLLLFVTALLGVTLSASAATIVNTGLPTNYVTSVLSSRPLAGGFTTDQPWVIDTVTAWFECAGGDLCGGLGSIATIEVSIWDDAGGDPGTVLFTGTIDLPDTADREPFSVENIDLEVGAADYWVSFITSSCTGTSTCQPLIGAEPPNLLEVYKFLSGDGTTWLQGGDWAVVITATAVPVPAAVWLFGSALGLLGWIRRKAA